MHFSKSGCSILYCFLIITSLAFTGCEPDTGPVPYTDPFPFPEIVEDNTGTKPRSVTYVYDRRAVDLTYPPKMDSSIIRFAYDSLGKIKRIRLNHNDFFMHDFLFERNNNQLTAIHCRSWAVSTDSVTDISQLDLEIKYNGAGNPILMRTSMLNDPLNDVDSFFIKTTGNRIDSVINPIYYFSTDAEKEAYTYNPSGDITQIDHIRTQGVFWSLVQSYKYTLTGSPSAIALGNEAIFWDYVAKHADVSSNTEFLVPAILFQSTKQASKLLLQVSGFYVGTYNYQTEYYGTGLPKKMTANVITETGAFWAREAYYYSYGR